MEDKLGAVFMAHNSLYGNAPFVSDYARVNASEDFAETFRALETEPAHLKRVAPDKYADITARLSGANPSRVAYRYLHAVIAPC